MESARTYNIFGGLTGVIVKTPGFRKIKKIYLSLNTCDEFTKECQTANLHIICYNCDGFMFLLINLIQVFENFPFSTELKLLSVFYD